MFAIRFFNDPAPRTRLRGIFFGCFDHLDTDHRGFILDLVYQSLEGDGNKILVVLFPDIYLLFLPFIITENNRANILGNTVIYYHPGRFMEKIADFIVAFAVKSLYSGSFIHIITSLRNGFVFC